MTTSRARRLHTPDSDSGTVYAELGYMDAYDAVLDCDYAFVAYRETSRSSGEWRVRIKSSQTARACLDIDRPQSCRGRWQFSKPDKRRYSMIAVGSTTDSAAILDV